MPKKKKKNEKKTFQFWREIQVILLQLFLPEEETSEGLGVGRLEQHGFWLSLEQHGFGLSLWDEQPGLGDD